MNEKINKLNQMEKRINKLATRLWAVFFLLVIILAGGFFQFTSMNFEKAALALTGNYNKGTGGVLTASNWNTLASDFVDKSGDTMMGDLNVPNITSTGNITGVNICNTSGDCIGNATPWVSSGYGYAFSDPDSSNTVSLGVHTFCALGRVMHDGGNGGWCNVTQSGGIWSLNYGKWMGGGIGCTVNCF